MAGGQCNTRTKQWSRKKPMLESITARDALMFKVKCHSCISLWTAPCFQQQPRGTWAETESLEMTQLEKACLERLSF